MDISTLHNQLSKLFPKEQLFTDELTRLVRGTDAGLYRLTPKAGVKVMNEEEAIKLLQQRTNPPNFQSGWHQLERTNNI